MEEDNDMYLRRLWSIYWFIIKFFFTSLCQGYLRKTPPKQLKKLQKRLGTNPIAHRGGYPEHTMFGYEYCVKRGVKLLEVDLNVTKDGHLVAFHDYTVERTSYGRGLLSDKTLAEVKRLDVGAKYSCPDNKVPTLAETVAFAKANDVLLFLDIKGTVDQIIPPLKKMFKSEPWLMKNAVVISFFPDIIYRIKRDLPDVYTGLSCCKSEFSHEYPSGKRMFRSSLKQLTAYYASRFFYFLLLHWLWKALGIAVLLPSFADIQHKRFPYQKYLDSGLSVVVWTISTKTEKKYISERLGLPYLTDMVL